MGTPHSGVNLNGIDTETFIQIFCGVDIQFDLGVDARHSLIESLRSSTMHLFDLTDNFRRLVSAKQVKIVSVFESKKTRLRGFPDLLVRCYHRK